MKPSEILEHFQNRESAIIDLIREIVEIESPSFDVAGSEKAAAWVRELFSKIVPEASIETIAAPNVGEHLLIRMFPSAEKGVLVLGHTDTVHPIGAKAKNPTRIEDGKFFGGGIFDMKSNIVLLAEAVRFFVSSGIKPPRPITLLLSCDEEVGSKTGRELVEREAGNAERCFVLEPSAAGRAKTGRKGTGMYTLRAHGVPSHAGLDPEKGASAILELSRRIERLHSLNAPERGTTVNVCTIKGGTTSNVIPEFAECSVDVRFSTMAEAERVDALIRSIEPADKRVSVETLGGINRPPMERTPAVIELFKKAKETAALIGLELEETQVGGASDGNFVGALGTPVLDGLGISGDGAHTLAEYINVNDIAKRGAFLTYLLLLD